jgi:hypothetical protein
MAQMTLASTRAPHPTINDLRLTLVQTESLRLPNSSSLIPDLTVHMHRPFPSSQTAAQNRPRRSAPASPTDLRRRTPTTLPEASKRSIELIRIIWRFITRQCAEESLNRGEGWSSGAGDSPVRNSDIVGPRSCPRIAPQCVEHPALTLAPGDVQRLARGRSVPGGGTLLQWRAHWTSPLERGQAPARAITSGERGGHEETPSPCAARQP